MQKKRIVLVLIAIFLVLAGIGGTKKVIEIRQEAQKERQVAFLKAHEKEMTEYIKKEAKDVRKVTYNWNSINVGVVGNGTPWGGGKKIQIFGYANAERDFEFRLDMELDEKIFPKLATMELGQKVYIDEGRYE